MIRQRIKTIMIPHRGMPEFPRSGIIDSFTMKTTMQLKLFFFVMLTAAALHGQNDSTQTAPDAGYISSIREELACYCGCGMTVQGCLGGMICGESRELSTQVIQHVKDGKNHDQVLQAMVAKYGESILSAPTKEGFNLFAWVSPFVVLIIGALIAVLIVSKWKRQSSAKSDRAPIQSQQTNSDPYEKQFEREFKNFDR